MGSITKLTLSACAGALAMAWALPAMAQETPPQAAQETAAQDNSVLNGEIVVTAQKRSENVQNVGIAITAYSGDQLRALGIQRSADVASFSPGVSISGSLAGQNTQFTIRGARSIPMRTDSGSQRNNSVICPYSARSPRPGRSPNRNGATSR